MNGRMLPADAVSAQALHCATLDNGLSVVVRQMHTAPLASVWCWYRVGSKDEGTGLTGASHFVEHMNFKGSARLSRQDMTGLVDRVGGTWNGYTWIDQTAYFETATRDALDQMLLIETERMASCLYDPADCEAERTVIVSELMGSENDPDQLLEVELTAAALRAHTYRHPTIGWLSDVRAMSRDDLYGHYRQYYVPNNATLVVVGAVDAREVLRLAARHFGHLPPGAEPLRLRTAEPPQFGERRVSVEREGTTAYLKIAWRAPAVSEPDFCPMLVLDAVLTGAKGLNIWSSFRTPPPQRSSRLYRALVDGGLASTVAGALLPTAQPFLYTLAATARAGVPLADVESAAQDEVDRVRRQGVTRDEFTRAHRQLRARLVFEHDGVTNVAHQLGFFSTVATLHEYLTFGSRLAGVTIDDVARVARERLDPTHRTVGWFVPLPAASGDGSRP